MAIPGVMDKANKPVVIFFVLLLKRLGTFIFPN